MKGIKINKISAALLLMVMIVGFGQGNKPCVLALQNYVEQEFYVNGDYPKAGDVFEVVYRVKLKSGVEPKSGDYCIRFFCGISEPIETIGKDRFIFSDLNSEEWKEFHTQYRILKPVGRVHFDVDIYQIYQTYPGKYYGPLATRQMFLYLLNSQTGQYGTREAYEKQLKKQAEWWYDNAGEFTSEPVSPACAAQNREIIAQMRQIEPDLTDWEALYLHYDGIQALMGGMGTQKTTWEDRWRFLLEQGWLEKQRAGKEVKERWLKELLEKYKGKPLIKEQGLNPNFFRGDAHHIGDNFDFPDSTKRWSYFYFNGQFRYKKHLYNKDQGCS